MSIKLSPIVKEALILLGKIRYLKEYDSCKIHLLGELVEKYINEIEPELLKVKESSEINDTEIDIDEILELFKEHITETERRETSEVKFFNIMKDGGIK
ncbi:MAG: hypothetical protein KAS01_02490 [Candidatus Pacebacteria bacterium]|nr:hypothetical protein [Candidatus Paceibacterota bacterium]